MFMSDSNQFMLDVLKWLAFGLAVWCLLSPIGLGIRWLLDRWMPVGINRYFLDLWSRIPGVRNPVQWLVERLSALRDRLLAARRIRVGVDNLHRNLAARLKALRNDLVTDLAQVSAAGSSGSNGTLVGLLQQFDAASDRAHRFEAPDDGLPDYSQQISEANSKRFWSWFFSLLIGVINCGLLYVFLQDVSVGINIPGTDQDIVVLLGVILPVVEFGIGYLTVIRAKDGAVSTGGNIAKWVVIMGFAAFEGVVFYFLFQTIAVNAAEADAAREQAEFMKIIIPMTGVLFGIGMVLMQSIAGQSAGEAQGAIKRLAPIRSIKQQLAEARNFVDELPQRYGGINQAAVSARQSVRDFLAQLQREGEGDPRLVNRLDQARQAFLDAVATVNPERWSPDAVAAEGDRDDAFRVAWVSVLLALLCSLVTIVCTTLLLRPIVSGDLLIALAGATVIAISSFLLLPQLLPRAALVVADGGNRQLWFGSGGEAGRYAAMAFAAIVSLSLVVIGVLSQGLSGLTLALFVVAAMAGIAALGGSLPQLMLGASFLFFAAVELGGFAGLTGWLILRAGTLWLLWVVCVGLKAAASFVALPITALQSMRQDRRPRPAAQP